MKEKLEIYIKNNLINDEQNSFLGTFFKKRCSNAETNYEKSVYNSSMYEESLVDYDYNVHNFINNNKDENNFQKLLFKLIDERNLKDSDVYNKVHIDRRLFSKIRSDSNYHPSKDTIILLGLSLELNENEIEELLNSASYSLPKNNYYDLIIRFCFIEKIYKIKDVNDLLMSYNCKLFNY